MNKTPFAALAALSLFAASSAFATPATSTKNYVNNGSFEDLSSLSLSNGTWGVATSLDGWKIDEKLAQTKKFEVQLATNYQTNSTGHNSGFNASYDGAHYLELNSEGLGAIYQRIGTDKGQSYTLTFAYSGRSDAGAASTMDVYWGGSKITSFTAVSSAGSQIVSAISAAPNSGWTTYTATVTGSLTKKKTTLEFVSTGPTSNATYGSYLDGVSVTAVPEPTSYAMLLAGLGVMATIARRRSKAAQA